MTLIDHTYVKMATNYPLPYTPKELLIPFSPQWGAHRAGQKLRPEKNEHLLTRILYPESERDKYYEIYLKLQDLSWGTPEN